MKEKYLKTLLFDFSDGSCKSFLQMALLFFSTLGFCDSIYASDSCRETFFDAQTRVRIESLEQSLKMAVARSALPNQSIFGPESMIWKVQRESSVRFGYGRIGLLQLAHPSVAMVLSEVSEFNSSPLERFKATALMMSQLTFSRTEKQLKIARGLFHIHNNVEMKAHKDANLQHLRGVVNDPHVMLWVHATYWQTALLTHEIFVKKLTAEELASFYEDTKTFAMLLGIPVNIIPRTYEDFNMYIEATMSGLRVTDQAVRMARNLYFSPDVYKKVFPDFMAESEMVRNFITGISTALLPKNIADQYDLGPKMSPTLFHFVTQALVKIYRLLPENKRLKQNYLSEMARQKEDQEGILGTTNDFEQLRKNGTEVRYPEAAKKRCPFAGLF